MATLDGWDIAAANNNDAPPDGWPENTMQYNEVNDTGREVQAVLRRFWGDINGSVVSAGTDAITITLNETGYTSYFDGLHFVFRAANNNTGAVTLNVNGIGVATTTDNAGAALAADAIVAGGLYAAYYTGTSFRLTNLSDTGAITGSSVNVTGDVTAGDDLIAGDDVSGVTGTFSGAVTVDSLTATIDVTATNNVIGVEGRFSQNTNPDLVDSNVPVVAGSGTGIHTEVGISQIQAKSNATTNNTLTLNPQGGNVVLGGNLQNGTVFLFHDTVQRVITTFDGIDIRGSSSNDPATGGTQDTEITLLNSTGATVGFIGFDNQSNFEIESQVEGGSVLIRGETNAGTARTLFSGDPDNDVETYYAGSAVTRTLSASNGGLEVNNTDTGGGFERVLTESDQNTDTEGPIFSGRVNQNGTSFRLPSGWSVNSTGSGVYNVTHNLGTTSYTVVASATEGDIRFCGIDLHASNSFRVLTYDSGGTTADSDFGFILSRY